MLPAHARGTPTGSVAGARRHAVEGMSRGFATREDIQASGFVASRREGGGRREERRARRLAAHEDERVQQSEAEGTSPPSNGFVSIRDGPILQRNG